MITNSSVFNIISTQIKNFESFAENFAKSRFVIFASEFNTNEKESKAIEELTENIKCQILIDDNGASLQVTFDKKNEYLEIMESGMQPPLYGGDGGIAHNPDGQVYRSKVPSQFWGQAIPELAKEGINILSEVKTMLKDIFENFIKETFENNKQKIGELIKQEIIIGLNGGE